ncbi:hypothetical protein BCR36DRAFT_410967 [Piromyces finnis]|uniref:Uncharacterized protein n=1 Tax=Piromyces finnis TaxID=1754191 RepID=A0A1Y1VF31_9FUNG|nr:hypothetical protein BCR36DRAFT_410967 [Piromyces finnis]|eukprot:ORX53812.1 hypothetical protein BCR36DRAFT_410967 [Piromyces finnis]
MSQDVQIDITYFNEISQFEIGFTKNIYHDRLDMIKIVHNFMQIIDISGFIIDYLFMLLPNFEFQKPITPSLDILFKNAETLIKDTFFVSAKTDGIRKLIIIINNQIYSITENFSVESIREIEGHFHLILDCEFINNTFIPFDILYSESDLRNYSYKERDFQDIQTFILSELENTAPNDGIDITSGTSTYFENTKVYKIKTINTVDIEFNGLQNRNSTYTTEKFYYRKKIEIIEGVPYNKKIVKYHRIKNKKINFIIEYDLDNKKFVKVRYDKAVSNSINTFNSVLLASYQKINIDIFSPKSNVFMRKYHNIIKQTILSEFRGTLLDNGTDNGGDIHKWNHFRKIICVEPSPEKLKNLNKRISNSEIKNRIKIIPNNIQETTLNDHFDIATCFFALNDMTFNEVFTYKYFI